MNADKLSNIIDLLGKLKDLKRSGWLRKTVVQPESVADHSFGTAFLALLLAPNGLDKEKCLKMAVLHDIQEAVVGDVTPFDGVNSEEKSKKEKEAVKMLSERLDYPELVEIFDEFEAQESPEARFMKDIDRLEAVLQAKYYDNNNRSAEKVFSEFYNYASAHTNQEEAVISEIFSLLGR